MTPNVIWFAALCTMFIGWGHILIAVALFASLHK